MNPSLCCKKLNRNDGSGSGVDFMGGSVGVELIMYYDIRNIDGKVNIHFALFIKYIKNISVADEIVNLP